MSTLRFEESEKLSEFFTSNKPELMVVYGRRRVGKTFLIREYFSNKKSVFFNATGMEKGTFLEQKTEFCNQIGATFYGGASLKVPGSWLNIFELLTKAINATPKNKKIVLFFDEFPWMVTKRSRLLEAFEYYWNQYWSRDSRIKLIVCGSLASWIIKNFLENTGGLYNRVTCRIHLHPLSLGETARFLKNKKIYLTNQQILTAYLVTGGIPLYLEQIKKGLSASQIVESLCFSKNGMLVAEMKNLFKSLFQKSAVYMEITREIAKHHYGITSSDLSKKLNILRGGSLSEKLDDLEEAGFIMSFLPYQHKEKGTFFRISDEYSLFYFRWIEPNMRSMNQASKPKGFWTEQAQSQAYKTWCGYAFESVCYKHVNQISKALGLAPSALPYSWRFSPRKGDGEDRGAQIDLLFDRKDKSITLCEIKHTDASFVIDRQYAKEIEQKIEVFKRVTKTDKQIFFAMVVSSGIKNNFYAEEIISNIVTLDDLFKA